MTEIEDTSKRDPLLHLALAMTGGSSGYIEAMEAQGQRELVASEAMPLDGPWDELAALGFVRGEPVDDMFVRCQLPAGWTKKATDHAMWSQVVDTNGVERVSVFYKAAFYDRRAFARLNRPETPASPLVGEVTP